MYKDLKVKKSQLPGAGKGLFTIRDIKKGERFVEYLGEIITEKELEKRAEEDKYGYGFYINKKKCIDAYNTPDALARFANDAKGLNRIKGLKNNCCYDVWKQRGWIKAERDIKAGEEIFVDYGNEYWADIKYNMRLDKKTKKDKNKKTSSK